MRRGNFIFIFLMINHLNMSGQVSDNIYQMLKTSFKELIENCTMEYTAECVYPDNTKLSIKGLMAMRNNSYYDSSNSRLLFKNDRWLINYDHINQTANVLNLSNWKKEYGSLGKLYISEYLDSDSLFLKNSKISIEDKKDGKLWLVFKFNSNISNIKSLRIQYFENSNIPIQYQGEMQYPMDDAYEYFLDEDQNGSQIPTEFITIKFSCFNIKKGAQDLFFDDSRFVEYNGKGAFLKKYKNYKMSKS